MTLLKSSCSPLTSKAEQLTVGAGGSPCPSREVSLSYQGFGCPPFPSSIFFVSLFWRSKFLRPNNDSRVSCQNGAPALRSITMITQPKNVSFKSLHLYPPV